MRSHVQKMLQFLSFSFPVFSLMLISLLQISFSDSNVYLQCSQLYNPMTSYESNVNLLFTSLVNSSLLSHFNKFEISHSDVMYGLFQCQGDLGSSGCKDCVTNAVNQLKATCRMSTSGTIQLEECFVKYDNKSFFGIQDKTEVLKRCGDPPIGYDPYVVYGTDDAISYLITGNGQYFQRANFGNIQSVAQCVQDMSLIDCQDCLLEASGRLRSECETSARGDMFLGKCYVRFVDHGDDDHPYNNVNFNSNNNSNNLQRGKENNKSKLMVICYIAITAAAAGGLTLAITVTIKNSNKKDVNKEEGSNNQAIRDIFDNGLKIIHHVKKVEYNHTR